ncbi:MAG: DNA polymerase subunit beta [Meiothermus sp.]
MEPLIESTVATLRADPKVAGILLTGSQARGDNIPGSDLDFWVLLTGVSVRRFRAEQQDGVWTEFHFRNLVQARELMRQNPMELYSHLDGRILYDEGGKLAELRAEAQHLYDTFQVLEADRRALAQWLTSAKRKLEAALQEGNLLKVSFLASTASWKLMEGLWAANSKPVPPRGAVFAHIHPLETPLPHDELLQNLFEAEPYIRAKTSLTLMDWVLGRLANSVEGRESRV